MSRVPKEELERVKREVPMARLAQARGVELTRVGVELRGLCPMHNDTAPSFFIDEVKNVWVCHGACGAGGSVVDFVMRTEGVSLKHAVEWLGEFEKGNVSPTTGPAPTKSTIPKLEAPFELDADDQVVLNRYAAYCHQVFRKTPAAQAYLESRGLVSTELAEKFQLGFSDRSLGMRLPAKGRAAGDTIRARLQKIGIMKQDVAHELMYGSLTVPITDENGQVVGMYGRKISKQQREGTPLHLYLPGPHRGVWNVQAVKTSKVVILCEAAMDAMTFWCAGLRNVTWAYGVNGFTDEHLDTFKKGCVEHVLIAFDADAAGDKGAELVAEQMKAAGLGVYRVKFPSGMDANDFGRRMKPMARCFRILCQQAQHICGPTLDLHKEFRLEEPAAEAVTPEDALVHPMAALVVSPTTPPPDEDLPGCKVDGDEVCVVLGERQWRVRGWLKNHSADVLKVNVMVTEKGKLHVDNLDLYSSRARKFFVADADEELRAGVEALKADIGMVLRMLERLQMRRLKDGQKPKVVVPPMTPEEREAALALLRDDKVCGRIVSDLSRCGLVGEDVNKLTAYLGCVSRRLPHPLAIMVQSGSGSGKTTLMDAVLAFMPEEERVKYSAMTGQALYYMGEEELCHKILAVVEEEGAERASYALKLLQSEGELMIASTAKDPQTGQLSTKPYRVKGPVMIFVTTTKNQQDDEFVNRCLVLTGDESREQTRAIHQVQREKRTVAGLFQALDRAAIRKLHQNAQRLLRPVHVVNPFVRNLTFIDDKTRTRRDFEKYLTLIDAVAVLRQHQKVAKREGKDERAVEYVEVDARDLEIVNTLAVEVLGRTLDELQAQTRKLLTMMEEQVARGCAERHCKREDFLFSRRALLDWTGWSYDQVRIHLGRLIEHEYVLVHRGNRGHQYFYELFYDGAGKDGSRFVPGMVSFKGAERSPTSKALEGSVGSVGPRFDPGWRPVGAGVEGAGDPQTTASERGGSPLNGKKVEEATDTPPGQANIHIATNAAIA